MNSLYEKKKLFVLSMWKLTLGHGNIINMLDTYVVIFVVKSIVMYTKLYHVCKSLVTILMNHKYTRLIFF